jgi:hypothetical protein
MLSRAQKIYMVKKRSPFKKSSEGGQWHVNAIERINSAIAERRARVGVRRLGRAEFKRKLMEDLKHVD